MADTVSIIRGANLKLSRPLLQSDGVTALPANQLVICQVDLVQAGKVKKTLVRDTDPELRNGQDGNSLELELTSAITAALAKGNLCEVYTLAVADASYLVDQKEIPKLSVQQVILE